MRTCLAALLSEIPGIRVVGQADDASSAVEGIAALKPRVVILDVHMPGGSGLEVLARFRHEQESMVRIIFTSHVYPQLLEKCKDLGADHVLSKATDFINVVSILTGLVSTLPRHYTSADQHTQSHRSREPHFIDASGDTI